MITKINRQKAIDKFPNLPLRHYDHKKDEDVFNYPKTFANYILTLPSKSNKGHIKLLGIQLVSFMKNLGLDNLIFLGDIDIAWLRRLNTYDVFQEALEYLVDKKIGKRFNGALQVDITEIPIFIKHLTRLVRTNGILPYIHFIDPGQNIIGSFCQYGSLHISTKTKKADRNFKNAILKSSFKYLTEGSCGSISKSAIIKERTITV
jgi:hypothetical protein